MGYRTAVAGNMRRDTESVLTLSGLPLSFVGSSQRWGVEKPDPRFSEQVVSAAETPAELIADVGDRVDNDIIPAKAAGMRVVFVRRCPWGQVHGNRPDASAADATIAFLADLPQVLEQWRSVPIESSDSNRLAH